MTRNAKGKVVLTQTWRFAFVARPPQTIRWKEYEGIRIAESDEIDLIDWLIGGILFLYGIIPGILFWWYVLRPDKLDVMLCKDHGCPAVLKDRFLPRVELPTPRDEWERRLLAIGTPCGANLSHEDLSSEALYD